MMALLCDYHAGIGEIISAHGAKATTQSRVVIEPLGRSDLNEQQIVSS